MPNNIPVYETPPLFDYGAWTDASLWVDAREHDLVVIDLEATGHYAPPHRICEIGMVRVSNDRIVDTYTTLINPERPVGPEHIHHISNAEVRKAPRFADVAGEVVDRMRDAVIVAHFAPFEETFLSAEFQQAGITMPIVPALCTHALASQLFNNWQGFGLAALCIRLGVHQLAPHTALGDARTTADVALRLFSHASTKWLHPVVAIAPPELPRIAGHALAVPRTPTRFDDFGR